MADNDLDFMKPTQPPGMKDEQSLKEYEKRAAELRNLKFLELFGSEDGPEEVAPPDKRGRSLRNEQEVRKQRALQLKKRTDEEELDAMQNNMGSKPK